MKTKFERRKLMTRRREFRGFVVAFFAYMFGVMLCICGVVTYNIKPNGMLSGIFLICVGIAVMGLVRQASDFYNFELLKLMRRFKAGRIMKKRQKSRRT